jgi:hypothetical protein
MATWCIYDNLRVTYYHPRAKDGEVQELGQAKEGTFDDLLMFATQKGDPGDFIYTPKGLFFIQGAPMPH